MTNLKYVESNEYNVNSDRIEYSNTFVIDSEKQV